MTQREPAPLMEAVDWSSGAPRSPRHGDVYHSRSGALAQARHVFLGGCALPQAWADRPHWHLLETGFGLGLNFLATWLAWREDPRRPRRLTFESVEAWPVSPDDIRRAARAEPGLLPLAEALAAALDASPAWRAVSGDATETAPIVRVGFDDDRVRLIVRIGDVARLLAPPAPGGADATSPAEVDVDSTDVDSIFLDGFSPARNPEIWSAPVLAAVAARLRRGGRLSTWSVAAGVRHALQATGLIVTRQPGLPPKRDCLVAWRPD